MSWDCPHWLNETCQLNGTTCKPGKGNCVLKDRFEFKTEKNKESTQPPVNKTKKSK